MEILIGLFSIALFLLPLILVLVNSSKVSSLTRRLQQLELLSLQLQTELEALRRGKPDETPPQAPMSQPKPEAVPQVKIEPPLILPPQSPPSVSPIPKAEDPVAPQMSRPVFHPSQPTPAKESRTSKEWEALIGGKILNRIGALALIIGVGFFLKYACDNDLISEAMRVLLGAVAGAGLLFGAARMHKKRFEIFSQGLVGAGIAILYLSVYAAFNFYHLIPQVIAFVLMSGVTMITLWQSLKYDSLAVALLGCAGGFLTPFMLSAGDANAIGLFTYLALLNAGLLTIVISREKWIILEPLALAATYFIYFLWFDAVYKPDLLTVAVFFLIVFWVLFLGYEAYRNLKNQSAYLPFRHIFSVANGILFFIGMYQLLEPDHHAWMGLTTLLIGIPYGTMFYLLRQKGAESQTLLARYILGAIVLVFSATAIQFSGFTTVTLWSVEACAAMYAGSKWNMKSVWAAATAMFGFAFFKLFFSEGAVSYVPLEEFRLLLNIRALAFVALGTSVFAATELLKRREEKFPLGIATGLSYLWCLVFFLFLSTETIDLFERWKLYAEGDANSFLTFKQDLTVAIAWMAYSVVLGWFGFRRNSRPALYSGIVVLILALFAGALRATGFEPIERYGFALNYRVLTLVLLVAGTLAHAHMWRTYGAAIKASNGLLVAASVAVVGLIFVLLTSETYDGYANLLIAATGDAAEMLLFKRVLTLSLVWMGFSCALTWFGLTRKNNAVLYSGIGIMALGVVVGLFRSLWYEPVGWFYPVFNFRFLMLILVIGGAVFQLRLWKSQSGDVAWGKRFAGAISLMIVALVLVLLTSETRDFFEKQIHVAQRMMGDNWTREFEEQKNNLRNMQSLALSGVWLLYSVVLMVVGIWKRYRNLRFVAIGLFGIAILKMFIYDLSFLQTLYRIFSFMGLGVILLGVSYLYQKYKSIILDGESGSKVQPRPDP